MQDQVRSSRGVDASLRLAVVGTGALGSAVCRHLLEYAHPSVLLIDPGRIEPRNLPLSSLLQQGGCPGSYKVDAIARLATRQGLPWETQCAEIADVGLGVLRGCDLLISATDSVLSRLETAFAARSLGLPMLDAGVQPRGIPEGRVSWFAPLAEAACPLCGLGELRRAELLGLALSASLGCQAAESSEPMTGALATVERTARQLLATLAGGPAEGASSTLRLNGDATERIELTRSPSCPWHGLPAPDTLIGLGQDRPVCEQIAPGMVLELGWPICLRARCRACGADFQPMRRVAFVRRALQCPACGAAGRLEPLRTLASLAAADPLARRTPRELGLADRQLYHQRRAHAVRAERSRA